MKSLTMEFLNSLNLKPEQGSALAKIGEYKGKQELFARQTPQTLETLRQTAIVESSECSNRLEGITAPHKRIEALVLKNLAPWGDRSRRRRRVWCHGWPGATCRAHVANQGGEVTRSG